MPERSRYRAVWSETARLDLRGIVEYIADNDVTAALSVLDRIEKRAGSLTRLPLRGRVIPELARFGIRQYRELICSPWRILYRVSGAHVYVLAVLDGRRNLEDVLLDRFLR